jgi:hypothetical protein
MVKPDDGCLLNNKHAAAAWTDARARLQRTVQELIFLKNKNKNKERIMYELASKEPRVLASQLYRETVAT